MRRARLLHVLASAPAAVLVTVAPALSTAAVGAAAAPPPYIVCIDPGHGGIDPGAIGLDGLVEKNLTLDISDRGKILPRRMTGVCSRHQRRLTVALKRARHIALLPYSADLR